ncbi:hypothetical protein EV175_000469 [Coemansia sp. RSA 1933]|nr:hypothetical protein EV175_000469 [Coemansia sp. RSA 1933]
MSEKVFKVVMLGAPGAGKTSLRNHFLYKNYTWQYLPTRNPDFVSTHVVLDNGHMVAIQIWDTGGGPTDRLTTSSLAGDADAIILVFDGASTASIDSLSKLLSSFSGVFSNAAAGLPVVLVKSKADLPQMTDCVQAVELCKSVTGRSLDIVCMETSARTGNNVDSVFQKVAELCQGRWYGPSTPEPDERPLLPKARLSRHGDPINYHRFDIDDRLQVKQGRSHNVAGAMSNRAKLALYRWIGLNLINRQTEQLNADIREDAESGMLKCKQFLSRFESLVEYEWISIKDEGSIGPILVRFIEDGLHTPVDLVVVGRTVESAFKKLMTGHVSDYLLQNLKCPVMVVKDEYDVSDDENGK